LRVPLSQPQFLLGAIFVLFVLFAPGGIAGLIGRITARRASHGPKIEEEACAPPPPPGRESVLTPNLRAILRPILKP
jgi:branched-chain amino acid transport system permease protein